MVGTLNNITSDTSERGILVLEAWSISPHLETGLEIALRLAEEGHKVKYLHIGSRLNSHDGSSEYMPSRIGRLLGYKDPVRIAMEVSKKFAADCNLPIQFAIYKGLAVSKSTLQASLDGVNTIEELKRLKVDNHEVGKSVASELISKYGCYFNPKDHIKECIGLIADFILSFRIAQVELSRKGMDSLVVFNGRFASVSGAATAARLADKQVLYHERGSHKNKFSLRGFVPHDAAGIQKEILEAWNSNSDIAIKTRIADNFFHASSTGQDISWLSFSHGFSSQSVDHIIDQAKKKKDDKGLLFTYFCSSDDEFACIPDGFYLNSVFRNQQEALTELAKACKNSGHSLIVRVHPHLAQKRELDRETWDNLLFLEDNLRDYPIVIKSTSQISSYSLMDRTDIVAVFGSTIGVEALYKGKQVLLLGSGTSLYDSIDADIVIVNSKKNLWDIVQFEFRKLKHADNMASLKYGYWAMTHGIEYKFYEPEDLFSGKFLGVNVHLPAKTRRHRLAKYMFARLGLAWFPLTHRKSIDA